jgi:hypothetical protein
LRRARVRAAARLAAPWLALLAAGVARAFPETHGPFFPHERFTATAAVCTAALDVKSSHLAEGTAVFTSGATALGIAAAGGATRAQALRGEVALVWAFRGGAVVPANDAEARFPKWVWFTDRASSLPSSPRCRGGAGCGANRVR